MKLKQFDERWIFRNYQEEKNVIGRVRLLEFIKEGLTFIPDEMSDIKQIIYGTQYWKCEILSDDSYYTKGTIKTFPIRYICHIGRMSSNQDEVELSEEEYLKQYKVIDKFIEIDGQECF